MRVSNSLNPDQARRFVGLGLVSSCLQKLSADDTGRQRINPYKVVPGTTVFSSSH